MQKFENRNGVNFRKKRIWYTQREIIRFGENVELMYRWKLRKMQKFELKKLNLTTQSRNEKNLRHPFTKSIELKEQNFRRSQTFLAASLSKTKWDIFSIIRPVHSHAQFPTF